MSRSIRSSRRKGHGEQWVTEGSDKEGSTSVAAQSVGVNVVSMSKSRFFCARSVNRPVGADERVEAAMAIQQRCGEQ